MGWEGLARIEVEKSSSHHRSRNDIGGDNPLRTMYLKVRYVVIIPVTNSYESDGTEGGMLALFNAAL